MQDETSGIRVLNVIFGGVMLITAGLLVIQAALISQIPVDDVVNAGKARQKEIRDKTTYGPLERPLTDAEIDTRMDAMRDKIVADIKGQNHIIYMKVAAAILLLGVSVNLFRNKPGLVRGGSVILVLLLAIGLIGTMAQKPPDPEVTKHFQSTTMKLLLFVDGIMRVVIFLSVLAGIAAIAKPPVELVKAAPVIKAWEPGQRLESGQDQEPGSGQEPERGSAEDPGPWTGR
jgi:hypothetical protein